MSHPLIVSRARLLLALMLVPVPIFAAAGYETPSPELVAIVDAPPTPSADLDPTGRFLLLLEQPGWPPISELAEPELRLAGLRIRPGVSGQSRSRYATGLRLVQIRDGVERAVDGLPPAPRIQNVTWSADGAHVAFTHTGEERIELWLLEVASGRARQLFDGALNNAARTPPAWRDERSLIVTLIPSDRGPEPAAPELPSGPIIEESSGRKAPARTYQDLLASPHDEALFEHYFESQLAAVEIGGRLTRLGPPGLVWDFEPSPSGELLLVETLHPPYSYRVPASRFPRRIEVLDRSGRVVHRVADLPLQEEIPMTFGSVATGPRQVGWRADAEATLAWVEALDGGDAGADTSERDRLFQLPSPFTGEPQPLATLGLRFAGISWGSDELALVSESWFQTRRTRTWRIRPGSADRAPDLLFDRSYEDRYSDPGRPLTRANPANRQVLVTSDDGGALFLAGNGASPEGDRPFLDTLDLETGARERLLQSTPPYFERPLVLLDPDAGQILVRRESRSEPPNYFVRDLKGSELRALTDFPHPTPQLAGIQKELLKYRRDDGVELTATLYTPPGYSPDDGPLPLLVWAYPREFKSAAAAGQVRDSPYRFDRISGWSPLVWLALGYGVLDDPAMPIVGEGEAEPNDTYVEQLVASARAAVEEAARRGVAEPGRIAIGGHSYGAFMTANLLSHSDLFATGIARSGAYNRTLTPFGFQAEQRSLWQAPEIYFSMSPFMHAEKVNEPLLLIHGEVDNNSGTFPLQSRRYYAALKGHGATVRLVMLPYESHGYRARESVLHMLWESERWLDTYLRAAEPAGR